MKSSVDKFYTQEVLQQMKEAFGAKPGDLILILSGDDAMKTRKQLCELRLEVAGQLGLRDKNKFACLWVIDFPLFEWSEETSASMQCTIRLLLPNPKIFLCWTAIRGAVRANAYDMVINGVEVGGGSIRIHDSKLQDKMFQLLGFTEEKAQERFGFLMNAFKYGALLTVVWLTVWTVGSLCLPASILSVTVSRSRKTTPVAMSCSMHRRLSTIRSWMNCA